MTNILKEGVIKPKEIMKVKCNHCGTEFETDEYTFSESKYIFPHYIIRYSVECPLCNRINIIVFEDEKQVTNKIGNIEV